MTIRVAVNEAILLRGTSGSARVTVQATEAMREIPGVAVQGLRPSVERGRWALHNAFSDARWDLRQAAVAARRADVLVSPCNIGRSRPSQMHLLFVYDVMVWESPGLFDPRFARYARRLIRFSVKRADRVLTLSSRARDFLLELVPSADVRVLTPPGRRGRLAGARWTLPPYKVLMVGETAAHKNHVAGIEAVRMLRAKTGADVRLHLVGPPGRAEEEVRKALSMADPGGTWAHRRSGLSDDEIDCEYGTAWALLQPSLNEGFGLPLVEASQRALPVLHSGAGGMAEVLPECSVCSAEPAAFLDRLEPLLEEDAWRRASAVVSEEAQRFSWEAFRCALKMHLTDLAAW